MEEITLLKNKKQEYVDDIKKLKIHVQKDIIKRQSSLRDTAQRKNRKKTFIRKVIYRIIQSNDKVVVFVNINSFLKFHLNNEVLHKIEVERDKLASRFKFKDLKRYMED